MSEPSRVSELEPSCPKLSDRVSDVRPTVTNLLEKTKKNELEKAEKAKNIELEKVEKAKVVTRQ